VAEWLGRRIMEVEEGHGDAREVPARGNYP
jgi:hypothetical protein